MKIESLRTTIDNLRRIDEATNKDFPEIRSQLKALLKKAIQEAGYDENVYGLVETKPHTSTLRLEEIAAWIKFKKNPSRQFSIKDARAIVEVLKGYGVNVTSVYLERSRDGARGSSVSYILDIDLKHGLLSDVNERIAKELVSTIYKTIRKNNADKDEVINRIVRSLGSKTN